MFQKSNIDLGNQFFRARKYENIPLRMHNVLAALGMGNGHPNHIHGRKE